MRLSLAQLGTRPAIRATLLAVLAGVLAGCGVEAVVHGINEKEANTILEVLGDNDVGAQKLTNASGRVVVFDISVSASDRIKAIKILNKYELPRRRDRGYAEVFEGGGMIPTSSEERAKRMAALEGEIERQLKLIEGVLDVQVQIVQPEESALRTTKEQEPSTTASVTIKYMPGPNNTRPVSEPEVQAIVAAGVEKLLPENVVVLMRQAGPPPAADAETAAKGVCKGLACLGAKWLMIGLSGLLLVILLLGLGLVFAELRLRGVRGRLIRLQNEIAKARKKPGDAAALPPPASGQATAS